jgi:hypothetical protein
VTDLVYVVLFHDRHADPWVSVYATAEKAQRVAFDYVQENGWPGATGDRLTFTGLEPGVIGLLAHASVGDGGFVYVYAVSAPVLDQVDTAPPAPPRERTYGTPRPPGGLCR